MTHVSSKATVLSEHAIAVAGSVADEDKLLVLIVKPQILEAGQFSKTGVVQADKTGGFKQKLEEPVTLHIEHSPESDRLSVQYAVMAVCKAASVPYNWDKSTELTNTECRTLFMSMF